MVKKGVKKNSKQLENDVIMEENLSIMAIIVLTLIFIFIGIGLGYLLYKLAMNNTAIIINGLLY